MIDGQLVVAPDNLRGFDCNRPVTKAIAEQARKKGYSFVARYCARTQLHDYDLTPAESEIILDSGLGLMVVQHVAPENWVPTLGLGSQYGGMATYEMAQRLALKPGTMCWLDLEGVKPGVPAQDVIDYCNLWHGRVANAGFNPGIYVGWHAGLSASDLYRKLRFAHYWAAYNLNADLLPAIRGVQLKQDAAKSADLFPPFTNQDFDVDVAKADSLGGRIQLLTRGWCQ
jgi:hypothetical protein